MKKTLLLILVALSTINISHACDICGCGVSSYYNGILPDFKQKIMGFRYRFNSLKTHIGGGGEESYLTTNEKYQSVEWWGGWTIREKFRVMASIPYSFNERENQGNKTQKQGIGDIAFSGYYRVFNLKNKLFHKQLLTQTLWIGGGIKLPTGEYNPAEKTTSSQNTNLFQLGTGSVDYLVNAMYDIRLQDVGLNLNASYKSNNTNQHHYQYGDKFTSTAQLYYKIRSKEQLSIAPNMGVVIEKAKKDLNNGLWVDISGGNLVLGGFGLEATYKKIVVGGSWQTPLSQNLANGFVKTNNRMMLHIGYAF